MKIFDDDLNALKSKITEMGLISQSMVNESIGAVLSGKLDSMDHIFQQEDKLDQLQVENDQEIFRIITLHSPVASSLRYLMTASHVITAFERIGDQVINLMEELTVMLENDAKLHPKIQQMCPLVAGMMNDALDSLFKQDVDKADATMSRDDLIDAMKDSLIAELVNEKQEDSIASVLSLILIGRALERIADQACNICEDVFYMVRGEDIRHSDDH